MDLLCLCLDLGNGNLDYEFGFGQFLVFDWIKDKKALSKAVKATSSDDFTATEQNKTKRQLRLILYRRKGNKNAKISVVAEEIVFYNNCDF